MKISRTTLVSAACSASTVLVVAFVAAGHQPPTADGSPAPLRPGTAPAMAAAAPAGPALDDIPGLGSSRAGLERDEVISYWEAWRRDTDIAACMANAGYTWVPEVLYPSDDVAWVADILGVQPAMANGDQVPPEDRNRSIEASLTETERDGYLQALTGESAKDIDAARESESVPEGRDAATFGEGGCRGKAMSAVGSIWHLERQLGPDLMAFRASAQDSAAFADVRKAYVACVTPFGLGDDVQGPGDLEALAVKAPAQLADVFVAADQACLSVWQAGNETAQVQLVPAFKADHQQALAAQQDKYAEAMATIRGDKEFLAFLQARAGQAS